MVTLIISLLLTAMLLVIPAFAYKNSSRLAVSLYRGMIETRWCKHLLAYVLAGFITVVRYASVGEQVAFVVFVDEVLRAVEIEVLRAQTRVEREQDFLGDVYGVSRRSEEHTSELQSRI